jgi:hypothetical protein
MHQTQDTLNVKHILAVKLLQTYASLASQPYGKEEEEHGRLHLEKLSFKPYVCIPSTLASIIK